MNKSSKPCGASESVNDSTNPLFNQIGTLLILTSIFFVNFVSRIVPAPLIPRIEADLNLSHADAGALFFMITLGYFIALTGSGFVSSRLNHKRTIIMSNTILGIALIGIAYCKGPWTMRLGLIALGMAAGLYLPSGIASLMSIIPFRHWGKAIAIHELAPNLGFVAAPLISEAVLVWFSWRAVFLLIGCVALIMSPVFFRFGRGGEFMGEAPSFASFRKLYATLSFWVMVLLFSLGIIATMGIYTMLPLYLVTDYGIDRNLANTLIALSRIAGVIMAFVGGWATDRIGPKQTLRIVLLVSGLMTLFLGIASRSIVLYVVFLQPLVAVCFFPAGFAAMSLIVSAELRSIAISLIVPLAIVIGSGLIPVFIGWIGDLGSFAIAITICGGMIMIGSIFVGSLKFYEQ